MKSTYSLYCDPQGVIRVIDLTHCVEPNEPTPLQRLDSYLCSVYSEELAEYHRRLEKAKQVAVECKDQKLAIHLINYERGKSSGPLLTDEDFSQNFMEKDSIYSLPGLEVNFVPYIAGSDLGGFENKILAQISVEESKTEEESPVEIKAALIMAKKLHNLYPNMQHDIGLVLLKELKENKFTIKRNL